MTSRMLKDCVINLGEHLRDNKDVVQLLAIALLTPLLFYIPVAVNDFLGPLLLQYLPPIIGPIKTWISVSLIIFLGGLSALHYLGRIAPRTAGIYALCTMPVLLLVSNWPTTV